jgi:hypothetical protein
LGAYYPCPSFCKISDKGIRAENSVNKAGFHKISIDKSAYLGFNINLWSITHLIIDSGLLNRNGIGGVYTCSQK